MTMPQNSHDHPHPGTEAPAELSPYARRARAMEALLVEKGVCGPGDVPRMVENVESRSPTDGARVVARAWVDPEFKSRLLADPMGTLAELGYTLPDTPRLDIMENTESVHHVIVCTLCSCYPRTLLGRPPDWYKSLAYRSRVVVDPRRVIKEFGLELPESMKVRVMDSTADLRYMVLPRRPKGAEDMSEEELMKLVTRDSFIGVAEARSPETIKA